MRQQTLLQSHDEHHPKLQPLGLMQGNQRNRVLGFLIAVGIGNQRNPFQQGGQTLARGGSVVFGGQGYELPQVFQSFLGVIVGALDMGFQARLIQSQFDQIGGGQLVFQGGKAQ